MADTIDIQKSEELSETHICKTIENTADFPIISGIGTSFRLAAVLPLGAKTAKPTIAEKDQEDKLLRARNKAGAEAPEAADRAWLGLQGAHIDLDGEVAA
jgi:hypothetical protein